MRFSIVDETVKKRNTAESKNSDLCNRGSVLFGAVCTTAFLRLAFSGTAPRRYGERPGRRGGVGVVGPEAAGTPEAAWRVFSRSLANITIITTTFCMYQHLTGLVNFVKICLIIDCPKFAREDFMNREKVRMYVNQYCELRDVQFAAYELYARKHGLTAKERQDAYAADITYGTNNEMGFDYLRDNMCIYSTELVQRGHAFAIVDEVDSILIDEARTPLIISGQGEKSTQLYTIVDQFVSN